jgi:hypothetical protein
MYLRYDLLIKKSASGDECRIEWIGLAVQRHPVALRRLGPARAKGRRRLAGCGRAWSV